MVVTFLSFMVVIVITSISSRDIFNSRLSEISTSTDQPAYLKKNLQLHQQINLHIADLQLVLYTPGWHSQRFSGTRSKFPFPSSQLSPWFIFNISTALPPPTCPKLSGHLCQLYHDNLYGSQLYLLFIGWRIAGEEKKQYPI